MAMKKKNVTYLLVAAAVVLLIIIFSTSRTKQAVDQKVKVQKGDFEIVVATSGELVAPNTVDIKGPVELQGRNIRAANEIKILEMIPEGTLVDSGDYVATLDPSSIQTRLKDLEAELEKYQSQLDRKHLDTSLTLRNARNSIKNMEFDLEEKKITVEQSIYEPPATQRQAKNNLEKALRDLEQEKRNYNLKVEQAVADIAESKAYLMRVEKEYQTTEDVMRQFVVYAPRAGMIIYTKSNMGDKRKAGSTISLWDLTIATLPDFSVMDSRTYVNEIDISKIKVGQPVRITIDAFPDKSYTGTVINVANIGEQLKNTDAKVFEVVIRMNGNDAILRPAMTSSNKIVTATFKDVLYIPIESLFGSDSITYVYKTNGTKQVVVAGEMNENQCIIEQGLSANEEIYLSVPEKAEKFKLVGEELIPTIKQRAEEKRKAEEARQEEARKKEEERRNRQAQFMGGARGMRSGGAASGMQSQSAGARVAPTQGGEGAAARQGQGAQRELPQEVKDMMEKNDTAGLRKYREERMKQRQQPAQKEAKAE